MSYDYLKTNNANKYFEKQADIIKQTKSKKILDIGCGGSRVNEFLKGYSYTLVGIDNDSEEIELCHEEYTDNQNLEFICCDAIEFIKDNRENYDCVIVSGFLYYLQQGWFQGLTPDTFVDMIVESTGATTVIVAEPRPSIPFKTPNFTTLFSNYAYQAWFFELDMHMGERMVFMFSTDRKRPILERKIKADFAEESAHAHAKQIDWTEDRLLHNVYIMNTETFDDVKLSTTPIKNYIGVCGGMKAVYKAFLDYKKYKHDFTMTWVDVVPSALHYRQWWDEMYPLYKNHDSILDTYKEQVNPLVQYVTDNDKVDNLLTDDRLQFGTDVEWEEFIEVYKTVPKSYMRVDAVNDIKLFNNMLSTLKGKKWFWYSNIHDWHQFRFTEAQFDTWTKYLKSRNSGLTLLGKVPPFTSSK